MRNITNKLAQFIVYSTERNSLEKKVL